MGKKQLLIGGLGLILALHLLHLRHYFFLIDDAFISFRYLQNWIEGHGLVYNPGEKVEGYTNFLWITLLAPLALLRLAPEKAAPVLSILCSLATLVLVFYFPLLTRREKELQPGWLLAPLFLALHRSYAVWATSGLETRLFTLLIFLGAVFAWRTGQNLSRRDPLRAGILFALAELCRPEGSLFFLVGAGLVVGRRWLRGEKGAARGDGRGAAIFIAVVLAHYLGRRWYYGEWLPNTFYAKAAESWWAMGFRFLGVFGLEYSYWMWLPLLAVWLRRSGQSRQWLPGLMIAFTAPYLAYVAYVGGDSFEYRFLDPVLPFLALFLQECLRDLARASRRPAAKPVLALFTLVFLLYSFALPWASGLGFKPEQVTQVRVDLNQAPWLRSLPGFAALAAFYEQEYAHLTDSAVGVRAEEQSAVCQLYIKFGHLFARFIREGYFSPQDLVCTGVAGAFPYYSRFPIVDFFGLTDAVIARQTRTLPVRNLFHEKSPTDDYLKQRGVDFILLLGGPRSWMMPYRLSRGIPALQARLVDPRSWPRRAYVVVLDNWMLTFTSPHTPSELLEMFRQRNLTVYLYWPRGKAAYPVPLADALATFPELDR